MITQNTFADGINMDVNPLVAPKTVMSNCLNGTLITYNGNENVLQNDMGNGKVSDAFLPKGWVPVGMQEYGGIIYVAAYNPETKESLLGSFPSPLQNFENSTDDAIQEFTLKEGKYLLFQNKDLQLKPGNKLAVALVPDLYPIVELNFNNDNDCHKKHWSILLCLLTANGILVDVTDNLSTLVNPDTNIKDYEKYFFLQESEVDLNPYLRIYSGTLVGIPYILVAENLASSMDVEILPGYDEVTRVATFKVKCTITSSSLLYGYINKNGEAEEGLKGIWWRADRTWTGSGFNDSGEIIINNISTINNVDNQEYTVVVEGTISIENVITISKEKDIVIEIYPLFEWNGVKSHQESLMYRLAFDVTKIGTGTHEINQWRYYYAEDFITLTWGMESYPALGEEVREVNMRFIGYDGEPINFGNTTLTFKRSTFNGEFTEVFDSQLFTYKFPYIVEITWCAGTKKFLECRWIIPTSLYNAFYQSKRIQDFSKPSGTYLNDFKAMKVLEGTLVQFAEKPMEEVIDLGWDNFPIVSKDGLPDRQITYTKIYQYTPSRKLKVTEFSKNYPFLLNYTNVRDLRINEESVSNIKNCINVTHDICYKLMPNINVSKVFELHKEDFINNYAGYVIIGVTRFRDRGDENRITLYAYDNKGMDLINPTFLLRETSDANIKYDLTDYWDDSVRNSLNSMQSVTEQFVIPIIFFAERCSEIENITGDSRVLGLNYVINKDGEWYLYWNHEIWVVITPKEDSLSNWIRDTEDSYDKLRYKALKERFPATPNTVYEDRINPLFPNSSLTPFTYIRCNSTKGSTINGWLAQNNSNTITLDSEEEFKFTVKVTTDLLAFTTIDESTLLYKDALQNLINNWFKYYLNDEGEIDEKFKDIKYYLESSKVNILSQLTFNGKLDVVVELEYLYTNIIPGTYELSEQLNNYKFYGIDTLILYNGEYITPKQELDPNNVYLYENEIITEAPEASTYHYKDFKYIVGTKSWTHPAVELKAKVNSNGINLNLRNIPTFNGASVFKYHEKDSSSTPSSNSSEGSSQNDTSSYGEPIDANGDGVTDYWLKWEGYYDNGFKRMLLGYDTDDDGIPDKWIEANHPRNT